MEREYTSEMKRIGNAALVSRILILGSSVATRGFTPFVTPVAEGVFKSTKNCAKTVSNSEFLFMGNFVPQHVLKSCKSPSNNFHLSANEHSIQHKDATYKRVRFWESDVRGYLDSFPFLP
jgi:hypothetical protein